MAVAAVQRKIKAATTASISIGSGDGWATPTAGNLLVVSANSDATVTIGGGGWTSGPSIIDGNGAYTWYKVSAGNETTITASPSVSADIVLSVCEYSGVAAFDAQNSSTIAGTNGTVTSAASVTTSATGDLIVAFALLHSPNVISAFPTSVSWTNSFTNVLTGDSPATGGSHCTTLVAELLPAGAAGSYSTAASWTNQMADRQHIILAFTASGGASPVAAAGTARAAGIARTVATKVVAVAARCVASVTALAAVRKAAPATARATAAPAGAAVARHVGVATSRQVAVPMATGAAVKRLPATGNSVGAASAVMSGSSRAATGRCVAVARATAVVSRRTPVVGTAGAAPMARGTVSHRVPVTASSSALAIIRSAAAKRLALSGRAIAAVTAVGIAGPVGSTRPAVGRCTAAAICRSRTRHLTPRPNSGITSRPFAGITYRP